MKLSDSNFPIYEPDIGFVGNFPDDPQIFSVSDLIYALDCIIGENDPDGIWYRGQSSRDYRLLPKIFRGSDRLEGDALKWYKYRFPEIDDLLNELKDALRRTEYHEFDSAELWFLAQHYGLPTPLLDWTLDPLVALWFALKEGRWKDGESGTPVIYLCSSQNLSGTSFFHKKDTEGNHIEISSCLDIDDGTQLEDFEGIIKMCLENDSTHAGPPIEFPIGVYSERDLFSRLSRQSGRFTLSGPWVQFRNVVPGGAKDNIVTDSRAIFPLYISGEAGSDICRELKLLGITSQTVYGETDLDELVKPIVDEFNKRKKQL